MTPARAALYARISTSDKAKNVEVQLRPLREYAAARGWTVVDEYRDEGISGVREKRPALDRLLADVRRRRVDVVVVAALDRLGRSLPHLLRLVEEWEAVGVRLVSLREGLDFTTPSGRLLFAVVGALAAFERDILRERIRAGIALRRARGLPVGRQRTLTPAVIAEVRRRRVAGESYAVISRAMRVPRSSVIRAAKVDVPGAGAGPKTVVPATPESPVLSNPVHGT